VTVKYLLLGAISESGQPAARVRRHPVGAPVLERRHERVLHELLGQADVA
jgi:hypothetical protein